MKWPEIRKRIDLIMKDNIEKDIHNIIIFPTSQEKLHLLKDDSGWIIRNKYKQGDTK